MAGRHATYAPSAGYRIATCPGSLLATKDLPDTSSFEAVEGTVAHAVHEHVLNAVQGGGRFPRADSADYFISWQGTKLMEPGELTEEEEAIAREIFVDTEMANYVQESVDWCLELQGEHFIEQRVDISWITPLEDQFGTCDHAVITMEDGRCKLVITDLKYGKGVKVFAEENIQLAMYALGFLNKYEWLYNFDEVVIRVSQPRLDHKDEWNTTVTRLYEIAEWLKERFTLALQPNAPFGPDEHACKFCRLKPTCPALAERTRQLAHGMFKNLDEEEITNPDPDGEWPLSTPSVKPMSPEQLAVVLNNAKLVTDFLSSVETRAVDLLMHNEQVPGYKLVEGRSNRRWRNDEAAERFLLSEGIPEEELYTQKFVSVAEAEKKLDKAGKEVLALHVQKPRGKPTLAIESDKREPYSLTVSDMFDDMDENQGL